MPWHEMNGGGIHLRPQHRTGRSALGHHGGPPGPCGITPHVRRVLLRFSSPDFFFAHHGDDDGKKDDNGDGIHIKEG